MPNAAIISPREIIVTKKPGILLETEKKEKQAAKDQPKKISAD
jgi:hypothetical protein